MGLSALRACAAVMAALAMAPHACADNPTYSHDIAPILREQCTMCHRLGGSGPFPLATYEDVRQRAKQVRQVVTSRFMPPWLPEDGKDKLLGMHRLSAMQLSDLQKWIDQGCAEGDPNEWRKAAATSPANQEWALGAPDMILKTAEPFTVPAEGIDVIRTFVFHVRLEEDRFLKAIDLNLDHMQCVHHAMLLIDATGTARMLDEAEKGEGYPAMGDIGFNLAGCAGGWTPGRPVMSLPEQVGRHLPKSCDVVVEMHFSPTGKPEIVNPRLGLYFNGEKVDHLLTCITLGTNAIFIPAGEKHYVITDSFTLPADVEVRSLMPHARYVCRQMRISSRSPDGRRTRTLLAINDWDFNFMQEFIFEKPIKLAAGTRITMDYAYDNSAENPRNPSSPPREVRRGDKPTDESALLFVQLVATDPGNIEKIEALHRKVQEERMKNANIPPATRPADAPSPERKPTPKRKSK